MAKYFKIGQVVENEKDGKKYRQLLLNKDFLASPKTYVDQAYLDKQGNRRFYLFEPKGENSPSWLKADICVKVEE